MYFVHLTTAVKCFVECLSHYVINLTDERLGFTNVDLGTHLAFTSSEWIYKAPFLTFFFSIPASSLSANIHQVSTICQLFPLVALTLLSKFYLNVPSNKDHISSEKAHWHIVLSDINSSSKQAVIYLYEILTHCWIWFVICTPLWKKCSYWYAHHQQQNPLVHVY